MPETFPLYPEPPRALIETCSPLEVDPACARCSLSRSRKHVLQAESSLDAGPRLLVVNGVAGFEDNIERKPLTGYLGQQVRRLVEQTWLGGVTIDTAVRCYAGRDSTRQEVTEKYIERCRPFLAETLRSTQPARIVALGSTAIQALFGRSVYLPDVRRGYAWIWNNGAPIPVFFLPAPQDARNNRFLQAEFQADLAWALKANLPFPKHGTADVDAVMVRDFRTAEMAVADLSREDGFAFDLEWAGFQYDPEFRLLACAAAPLGGNRVWVWDADALDDPDTWDYLAALLQDDAVSKGGANVKADQHALFCAKKLRVRGITFDVRLERKLLSPDSAARLAVMADLIGMGGHKEEAEAAIDQIEKRIAKWCAKKRSASSKQADLFGHVSAAAALGFDVLKYENDPKAIAYAFLDPDLLHRYVARDAYTTARLAQLFGFQLESSEARWGIWGKVVLPAARAIQRVEEWGVPLDVPRVQIVRDMMSQRMIEADSKVQRHAPAGNPLNAASPKQLAKILYEDLGLPVPFTTKSGAPSTNEDALLQLRTKHPLPGYVLEFRHYQKILGYLDDWMRCVRADGRVHPSIHLDGAATGRASMSNPNCFDADTEVLTDLGWIRIACLGKEQLVAQWDAGRIEFVRPLAYQEVQADRMVVLRNQHIDLRVTEDHRCLLRNRKTGELRVFLAAKYPEDWEQIHAGTYRGPGLGLTQDELIVLCATQADGTWRDQSSYAVSFTFKKRRKYDRLLGALERLGASFSSGERLNGLLLVGLKTCTLAEKVGRLLGAEKCFGPWVLQLSREELDFFVEEVFYWDGCITRMNHYSSSVAPNADYVQAALLLSGKRANIREYMPPSGRVNYQVDVTHRDYSMTTNVERHLEVSSEKTYCLTVPSSFILVRRNGKACVTGQCQNIGRADTEDGKALRDCFAAPGGKVFIQLDFSQLELRIAALLSGDTVMAELFRSGQDFHLGTAKLVSKIAWGIAPEDVQKTHRTAAKTINFAVLYGRSVETLAQTLNVRVAEAERIQAAIFGQFKQLAKWCAEVTSFTRKNGGSWTMWEGARARWRPLTQVGNESEEGRWAAGSALRSAVNAPVQGSASDFCTSAIARIVQEIEAGQLDAELILPIHDSLMLIVPEDNWRTIAKRVAFLMTDFPWATQHVPIEVDCEMGTRWGSLEKVLL